MQKPLFDVIVSAVGDDQGNGSFNVRVVNRYEVNDGELIASLEDVEFEEAFEFATDAVGEFLSETA